jgi:hypothetical protein
MSTISAGTTSTTTLVATGDTAGTLVFKTNDTGSGGTTAVTISTAQNVGIGTSSPTCPLNVVSASSSLAIAINGRSSDNLGAMYFYANNGSTQHATLTASATEFRLSSVPAAAVQTFYTNGSERMRIDTSGNLLLNQTSVVLTGKIQFTFNGSSEQGMCIKNSANSQAGAAIRFIDYTDAYTGGGIYYTSSNSITYATSSDYRLKKDVTPMTSALAKVNALKPITFKWKSDGSDGQGFIAHELAEVCPSAVVGQKDAVDANGDPQYQGVDTSFLVATLAAAIQELNAKVTALETQISQGQY